MTKAIAVASIDEEVALLGQCNCGGQWRLASETVMPAVGHWFDALIMQCESCKSARNFLFDITPFFEARPGIWS